MSLNKQMHVAHVGSILLSKHTPPIFFPAVQMSESEHDSSRNVRPRIMEDVPDDWMTLLCGHEESMSWLHVERNPHLYHDPLAPAEASSCARPSPSSEFPSLSSEFSLDDIADCPNLGINTHVVQAQKQDTQHIDRIVWNLQQCGNDVFTRIDKIARNDAQYYYIGISCAIKQRFIGGTTASGNEIIGHASTGFEVMEILYHTSCICAKRMEKALIARIREIHDIAPMCRNKSVGGEGMSGNAPIYFVYVAYSLLPPQKTPDFSRWEPSGSSSK